MTPDDNYESTIDTANELTSDEKAPPTETDTTTQDTSNSEFIDAELSDTDSEASADVDAAKEAWDSDHLDVDSSVSTAEEEQLAELANPFVGQWNQLISTTNWEKGRIISQWRQALIDSGADAQQYSDDAWARRVGGVTAPHVGRLRRVHDRFASTYGTYEGLYWSHFLAALDWDDAPMWLEGATQSNWSVAAMREQRWKAQGAIESKRPTASEIVVVDTDEDVVLPAQGGGRTKEYGDEPGTASGPRFDDPDFGDEEELMSLAGGSDSAGSGSGPGVQGGDPAASQVQPFAGLPELPDDLADAIEAIKLAVLRHKTSGWKKVKPETVAKYLEAVGILMRS